MISYAQNAEDVVLARVFAGRNTGRYVDVGACDPVRDSVTKHFYDLGWRGVNVEPIPELAERLREARPGDVTLAVALGAEAGTTTLHQVDNRPGWSTVDDDLGGDYREQDDLRVRDVEVPVRTLAEVLDEHPGPVDFLKIDVEGAERAVIEGADWSRHQPRVVVVEATAPGSPTPVHERWEPLLLRAGYRCGLFDGLNRFYARAEDTEALDRLAAPANVFDEFERFDLTQQRAALAEVRVQRAAEAGYLRRLENAVREAQEGRAKDAAYLETLRGELREAEHRSTVDHRRLAALRHRIAELESGRTLPAAPTPAIVGGTTQMTAFDTDFDIEARRAAVAEVPSWFHCIEVGEDVVTPGAKPAEFLANEWQAMRVPELTDRSVLDIGAWDGWFSFTAERAGASRVVALDHYAWSVDWPAYWRHVADCRATGARVPDANTVPAAWRPDELPGKSGFDTARRLRGSAVEQVVADIATSDLSGIGRFDVVLFVGVLYHLADPVAALRQVYSVTGDLAVIGTHAVRVGGFEDRAFAEFFPHDEFADDPTNWWTPNLKALTGWCEAAGFSSVEVVLGPPEHLTLAPGESDRYTAILHARR